jgi:hypothetical protein
VYSQYFTRDSHFDAVPFDAFETDRIDFQPREK